MTYADFYNSLAVGSHEALSGDVTTLNALFPGYNARTETNLGYHQGRLDAGYKIALLVQQLTPEDFSFGGTTLNSGGKLGLPGRTAEADSKRTTMTAHMTSKYGAGGVSAMKSGMAGKVDLSGAKRIAKVLPKTPHSAHLPPSEQYPQGGGFLQWNLGKKCQFLIALSVEADGTVLTPSFTLQLTGQPAYDSVARIRKYLQNA